MQAEGPVRDHKGQVRPSASTWVCRTSSGWGLQKVSVRTSLEYQENILLINDLVTALCNVELDIEKLRAKTKDVSETLMSFHLDQLQERLDRKAYLDALIDKTVARCNYMAPFEGLALLKPFKAEPNTVASSGNE